MAAKYTEDDFTSDLFKAGRWDIWVRDDIGDPPGVNIKLCDRLFELLRHLGVADAPVKEQQAAVRHFLTLPAAIPMPERLRREAEAFTA